MPFAFAAFSMDAAEPESIGAMIRTLAPSEMHWSACVFCFCGSPCALTTRAEMWAALNDLISAGLSNCSHRTDVFVSGMRPHTWMPADFLAVLAVAPETTMAATTATSPRTTMDIPANFFTLVASVLDGRAPLRAPGGPPVARRPPSAEGRRNPTPLGE